MCACACACACVCVPVTVEVNVRVCVYTFGCGIKLKRTRTGCTKALAGKGLNMQFRNEWNSRGSIEAHWGIESSVVVVFFFRNSAVIMILYGEGGGGGKFVKCRFVCTSVHKPPRNRNERVFFCFFLTVALNRSCLVVTEYESGCLLQLRSRREQSASYPVRPHVCLTGLGFPTFEIVLLSFVHNFVSLIIRNASSFCSIHEPVLTELPL